MENHPIYRLQLSPGDLTQSSGDYMENHPIYRLQLSPGDLTQSSGIASGLFSLAILKFGERLGRCRLWYCFEGHLLSQFLAQPCDGQWKKRLRPQIVHSAIVLHTVSIYRTESPTKRIVHICLYLVTKNVMFIWHLSLKWQKRQVRQTLQISHSDVIYALCYSTQRLPSLPRVLIKASIAEQLLNLETTKEFEEKAISLTFKTTLSAANLSCENEFYLQENNNSFSYQRLRTLPRFKTDTEGRKDMACSGRQNGNQI